MLSSRRVVEVRRHGALHVSHDCGHQAATRVGPRHVGLWMKESEEQKGGEVERVVQPQVRAQIEPY